MEHLPVIVWSLLTWKHFLKIWQFWWIYLDVVVVFCFVFIIASFSISWFISKIFLKVFILYFIIFFLNILTKVSFVRNPLTSIRRIPCLTKFLFSEFYLRNYLKKNWNFLKFNLKLFYLISVDAHGVVGSQGNRTQL